MNKPFRIPTIVGLFLVIIIITCVIYVTEKIFRTPSGATSSIRPTRVHTANLSDTTFAVSWITDKEATWTLFVNVSGQSERVYYDDRDSQGKLGKYTMHYVSVRDALPDTTYSVTILSNGVKYLVNGQSYNVTTPASLPLKSSGLEPAYGIIQSANGIAIEGALVYLTVEGGQELSAMTNASGLWLIPLNQIRTADLSNFLPTNDRLTETVTAYYNGEESSAVTDTLNDSPVPAMSMGKTYDFRRQQANVKTQKGTSQTLAQQAPASSVLGQTTNRTFTVSLLKPAQGAALATSIPLVSGTGIPGKYVGVSLGITKPISGSTKVNTDGQWSFTPAKPLAAGRQSVTILTADEKNKPVAITHAFEILKSGTQVLGDATPSATLSPTPTEELTETPTVEPTETVEPTSTQSGEPPPNSGYELPMILLCVLGISLFTGGLILAAQTN